MNIDVLLETVHMLKYKNSDMFRYRGAILLNLISRYKPVNHVTETAMLYNVMTILPR